MMSERLLDYYPLYRDLSNKLLLVLETLVTSIVASKPKFSLTP